jgi:hypothetical protein
MTFGPAALIGRSEETYAGDRSRVQARLSFLARTAACSGPLGGRPLEAASRLPEFGALRPRSPGRTLAFRPTLVTELACALASVSSGRLGMRRSCPGLRFYRICRRRALRALLWNFLRLGVTREHAENTAPNTSQ